MLAPTTVKTNQPPQDLFISSMYYLFICYPSVAITYHCLTTLIVKYLFCMGLALESLSYVKPKRRTQGTYKIWSPISAGYETTKGGTKCR